MAAQVKIRGTGAVDLHVLTVVYRLNWDQTCSAGGIKPSDMLTFPFLTAQSSLQQIR